jgi:hypothetical protein
MDIKDFEAKLIPILKGYNASKIGVFGSYARGEAGPESDLDLLVDFTDRKSLLTLVLTENAISPHLIDRIKSELRIISQ